MSGPKNTELHLLSLAESPFPHKGAAPSLREGLSIG